MEASTGSDSVNSLASRPSASNRMPPKAANEEWSFSRKGVCVCR